ncbi:oligopeptide transport system substrate-binding protein [Marininema mesophilum]|uniref:Oligopeptide transport system substrate-binding protein n=1 Tax=Marininema mesophilum TaxID=1048340 RepID=A0A1H2ZTF0_9BACL|nr:peptide ABC transporter substrate-binding protein [Marininema mesophilum]SDX20872.1 oligopeptide transport system substrate-binding protein [Marininema mesophilum]
MGKGFKVGFIGLGLSLMLSACSGVNSGTTGEQNGGADAKQVLEMSIASEPNSLDPSKAVDTVAFDILNNIDEGLFRLNEDNRPEEAIASKMEISPDKKVYTFTLRDAEWSDGKPITAKDFEYSWKRTLNPKTASEYSYILYAIKNAEAYNKGKKSAKDVGVKAVDDKTLRVELKNPSPFFQGLTAFPVFFPERKDIVEKHGNKYGTEPDKMVTNGPFSLSEWQHEQKVQLKKSMTYWDRSGVELATANMSIMKDTATGVNLYNTGKADITQLDAALSDAFKKSAEFTPFTGAVSQYISFNSDNKFLANTKIRKAISYAIDRDTLAKLLKDGSKPATTFVPPTITGTDNENFRKYDTQGQIYNPTEAKRLLKEGMKEAGYTSKPKLSMLSYDDYRKQAAIFIQEQLNTILGIDVEVNPQPLKQKSARETSGDFEMSLMGWGADYNDPMTFLDTMLSDNPFNTGNWKNKEYDSLIKKSQTNPHFKKRFKDMAKAEGIMLQDAAIAPVLYGGKVFLQKQYVKDIVRHPVGAELSLKWAYLDGKTK